MIRILIENHPLFVLIILFISAILIGYGELRIFNQVTLACTTWLFAVIFGIAIFGEIFKGSIYGMISGILFGILGIVVLIVLWHRSTAKR